MELGPAEIRIRSVSASPHPSLSLSDDEIMERKSLVSSPLTQAGECARIKIESHESAFVRDIAPRAGHFHDAK